MKKYLSLNFIALLFAACAGSDATNNKEEEKKAVDTIKIELTESAINGVALPVIPGDVKSFLKNAFQGFELTQKTGKQDGPDFEYFELSKDTKSLALFIFDAERKNRVQEVIIKNPEIVCPYGLRIGDSYENILDKRGAESLKNYSNMRNQVYVYKDFSNISYEVNASIPANALEKGSDIILSPDDLKGSKIVSIVWQPLQSGLAYFEIQTQKPPKGGYESSTTLKLFIDKQEIAKFQALGAGMLYDGATEAYLQNSIGENIFTTKAESKDLVRVEKKNLIIGEQSKDGNPDWQSVWVRTYTKDMSGTWSERKCEGNCKEN
jgi:hypothetical protein